MMRVFMQIAAPLTSEASPILQRIEVASSLQIPSFHIIGLPSQEVAEARERVRAAIQASELKFPRCRVVINLSPACIRKRGTGLDLGMALSILADSRGEGFELPGELVAWGELGLNGRVKPVGQLMRALYAAWKFHASWFLLSRDEQEEASSCLEALRALVEESGELTGAPPALIPAESLGDAWKSLKRLRRSPLWLPPPPPAPERQGCHPSIPRFPEITDPGLLRLSPFLQRCLGVAVAGRHHLLLLGPRGTGKSHALEWLVALQPRAKASTRVHHRLIRELGGVRSEAGVLPPIRRVSSQVKPAALIGSASPSQIRPGEFSLAHGGVLIADELPEWARDSREAFREPLERGRITLTRVNGTLELPAKFALAATGNPCGCGGWPARQASGAFVAGFSEEVSVCQCAEKSRKAYLSRLSGPLLDRIDMTIMIQSARDESGSQVPTTGERALERLRDQVARAQAICRGEWGGLPGEISSVELDRLLSENPFWQTGLTETGVNNSLRSRHKVLRIAMTLGAWDAAEARTDARTAARFQGPGLLHFREAFLYRPEALGLG